MRQFIRITDKIININYIQHISIHKDKYILQFAPYDINGLFFAGFGGIESSKVETVIDKNENIDDYNKITKFIESIE